jgi:hypothetical protein
MVRLSTDALLALIWASASLATPCKQEALGKFFKIETNRPQ